MKRVVRSLLLFFCTTLFMLSASVCVCVVRVHADGVGSYISFINGGNCVSTIVSDSNNYGVRWNTTIANGSDVRAVIVRNDRNFHLFAISTSPFKFSTSTTVGRISGSCVYPSSANYNASSYSQYYVMDISETTSNSVPAPTLSDCPIYVNLYPTSSNGLTDTAIYYTFGEGAVDPVEPVNWGLVAVKGYQTNIAGQGQAAIHNVDVISWDSDIDTEGNDITAGNVRIRFIPGEYRSSNKNDLLSQTYNDFILDIEHAATGNVIPVTTGSASFKWSDVIDTLNFSSMDVFNTIHDNDTWFKRGWIYEIRLEIDDYIGEWQPIYASTSSGVENDLTIVNTSVITQNTITAIQQVNSINSTNNIWIVNGQPVDPNPEQTPPEDENEKPWWVYLLEMINNTLGIQNEYINEGTDESIEVVNNFEDDHTELNTTVEDYDEIENNLVIDMNNNLEQIEVESDLIENNSFLSSARWVAEQYTRITTDNPIGSILKFSLVLGFVMIFLGRFRQ